MEDIFNEQRRLLSRLSEKKRYLYDLVDWNQRCIGIVGARGTGKTTLMLQRIKEAYGQSDRALYASVDSPFFQATSLFEFARDFYQHGGEALFIDEVHKYPEWSVHVKSIYDSIPELKVVFSGSSLLQIAKQKGDLSRRAIMYGLQGMSFREYINFSKDSDFKPVAFEKLLKQHVRLAAEISGSVKVLRLFREYLHNGYYPFFMEGAAHYDSKLREIINHILEVDLPFVNRVDLRQISKIKKLLYLLSVSVPFVPNITKLAQATELSRPTLYEYLEHLQEAKLLNLVRAQGRGYELLTKPDKILLENTNLMYAIAGKANTGAMRELFFVNQTRNAFSLHPAVERIVEVSAQGDFVVNGAVVIEVGGKKKGFKQIEKAKNGYVAADDIESGFGNKIPLWMFGFLY